MVRYYNIITAVGNFTRDVLVLPLMRNNGRQCAKDGLKTFSENIVSANTNTFVNLYVNVNTNSLIRMYVNVSNDANTLVRTYVNVNTSTNALCAKWSSKWLHSSQMIF